MIVVNLGVLVRWGSPLSRALSSEAAATIRFSTKGLGICFFQTKCLRVHQLKRCLSRHQYAEHEIAEAGTTYKFSLLIWSVGSVDGR